MQPKGNIVAILFTATAIIFNFWYMGPPVIFLNLGLIISLMAWLNFKKKYSKKLIKIYVLGILIQITHVLEEYNGGLFKELPAYFNIAPWAGSQFLTFNFIWLIIFILAAIGATRNIRLSYLVIWFFLIIGTIGNGIFHLGFSLIRGEYFPGSISAFFLLVIGIFMILDLTSQDKKIKNE